MIFGQPDFHGIYDDNWPTIDEQTVVPIELRAEGLSNSRSLRVVPGFVNSVVELLTGNVRVLFDAGHNEIHVQSNGKPAGVRHGFSVQVDDRREWAVRSDAEAGAILIAEALLLGNAPKVKTAWQALVKLLDPQSNVLPMHVDALSPLSDYWPVNAALLRLLDAMHVSYVTRAAERVIRRSGESRRTSPGKGASDYSVVILRSNEQSTPVEIPLDTALRRLIRRVKRGGTALLIGPTGTFKTETAKRAALAGNAQMFIIKGRPGMEDRDFYGGVYPTAEGPTWVDGPLTAAFRNAQQSRVTLIVDELLRLEPFYRNVLIGALDTLSAAEVTAMGGQPLSDARHYQLALPTGENVFAPAENFALIATTNLGDSYQQLDGLDDALLRRFTEIHEFPLPDPEVSRHIYMETVSDRRVVNAAIELEVFTRTRHRDDEGLLARPANPGVILNLLDVFNAEREEPSVAPAAAFRQAVEATLIPYCVPRESSGVLEESAAAMLRHEAERIIDRMLPGHAMIL